MTPATKALQSRVVARGRVLAVGLALGGLVTTLGASGASGAQTSHASKAVVISTLKTAKFGTILVSGRTVYTLKPDATACAATCIKFWEEVLLPKGVTKATAGAGVSAAKLGTVKRAGGLQVTYAGKALYWFVLDKAPGQVKGNVTDTWGKWSVVVTATSATATTTTTAGGSSSTTTTVPATTTTSPGGGGIGF
jgi:predicted lipoprotein with Yx(FWY)xxD motif